MIYEDMHPKNSKWYSWYGARHTQMLLIFGLLAIGYAMRVNLSVAIRAMTDPHASKNPDVPTYHWENTSIILSSFFLGYVVLQILAGSLTQKYGPKWFLAGTMGINCIACLVIPTVADTYGSTGVIICRVLQGLSQGFFYPSCHCLLGKWVPANERTMTATLIYGAGPSLGTVIGMSVTGIIAESWVGWPVSFYLFGSMGLVWMVIWCFFGYNSPKDHYTILEKEKRYIEASLATKETKKNFVVPWKQIATSMPVWAIIVAQSGQDWGFTTLITEIPTYLNKVKGFPIEQNGFLSAAPYIAPFFLPLASGSLSDMLINNKFLSRTTCRKVFQSISDVIPALALILLGYNPKENVSALIALLIIAVAADGAAMAGYNVNHVDLSTNYAGILMGIANTISSIFSAFAPLLVQAIVPDAKQNEESLWRTIFIISAVIYLVSDLFFVTFASGEVQPWNNFGSKEEEENSTETENGEQINSKISVTEL